VQGARPPEQTRDIGGRVPWLQIRLDVRLDGLVIAHTDPERRPDDELGRLDRFALDGQDLHLDGCLHRPGIERDAVDQDERLDVSAVVCEELCDAAAGRVSDDRDTVEVEVIEQLAHVARLRADVQASVDRSLGVAEAEEVGHEDAMPRGERRGQPPPQVRGQREPVQQEHRRSAPLVVVGKLAARRREPVHGRLVIASATRSARTVARTSCARITSAPAAAARTAAASEPSTRSVGSSASVSVPMKRLRDTPITSPASRSRKRPRSRSRARLCSRFLPKPIPGSTQSCSASTPSNSAASTRSRRYPCTSSTTSSYRGSTCIEPGSPCMCIRTMPAVPWAATRIMSGSAPPEMSLTIAAPAATPSAATFGWRVSMLIATS